MSFFAGLLLFLVTLLPGHGQEEKPIGVGIHPDAAIDPAGGVHVVYGRKGVIFYTTSPDGQSFSNPVVVDSIPGLHLGASRGPQIAATAASVVITAIDKPGNIWAYTLDRASGRWQPRVRITDVPDIAKEGFVALTAGEGTGYYAAWLDLRGNQQNKIMGARSVDGGRTWLPNQLVYESPEGTVCECCQLSVVSRGRQVALMFRNFLAGARDMYLLRSEDGGATFGKARKMGKGTWPLKGCPMDGGGLYMAANGTVSTVWRRADSVFVARPGMPETGLAVGKNAKISSTSKGDYIVYQQAGQIWAITPAHPQPWAVAPGGYPKLTQLANNRVLCLWEQEGTIRAKIIG